MCRYGDSAPRRWKVERAFLAFPLFALLVWNSVPGNLARAAVDCSKDAVGPAAYERVKQKVRERFPKIEWFDFEPYDDIEISSNSECVFVLHGRFSFKKQRNQESRVYDARVTPNAGAPGGIKILKLQVSPN